MKRTAFLALTILLIPALCCKSLNVTEPSETVIREAIARNVEITSDKGSCLGVIVSTGRVITAAHCSGENMKVEGQPAKIVRANPKDDLMLLETVTPEVTPLVVSDSIYVSQPVFSVANFDTHDQGNMRGLTDFQRVNYVHMDELFVTRLQMLKGYSGSAVYDYQGRLIGIEQQIWGAFLEGRITNAPPNVQVYSPLTPYSVAIHGAKIRKFLA